MDLCDGDNILAEETMYFCRLRGLIPAITPTIGHAFVDMSETNRAREAMVALFTVRQGQYGLQFPTLDPVGKDPSQIRVNTGIAGFAADKIIEDLALEGEYKTVALIIAEASVMQAKRVVLEDRHFSGLDARKVNSILSQRGLATLKITNRLEFYGYVSGQQEGF